MSDFYGDEPLNYLSQTPQRQHDSMLMFQAENERLKEALRSSMAGRT